MGDIVVPTKRLDKVATLQHVSCAPSLPSAGGHANRKSVNNLRRSGQTAAMQAVDLDEREETEARTIARQAEMSSATAEWNIIGLRISDLSKYLHKQRLPEDCNPEYASLPAHQNYVTRTYSWVTARYNPKKPIHHLALMIASMFAKIIPDVAHGSPSSHIASVGRNTDAITAAVRAEPWTSNNSTRKGSVDPHPFLIMVFVYIVALMEPESPLRRFVDADPQGGLGQPWTKKHGR